MGKIITARSLLKTSGIIRADPETTLAQILPNLTRSHDAVFVFDPAERDKLKNFLGVVSPNYVLFKKKLPSETKAKHCLFHPPKLTPNTPFWEIAEHMLASRLYFLPIFEHEKFLGITSVNRLFSALEKEKEIIKSLSLPVKRDVVTISSSSSTEEAYNLLRKRNISRIAVVDKNGRLVGVVTRYHLRQAFAKPQRGQAVFSRKGDKKKALRQPLAKYYKNMVMTVPASISGKELFRKMLAKGVSSIVVINSKYQPVGIVSTHDVLRVIAELNPELGSKLIFNCAPDFTHVVQLRALFNEAISKLHDRYPVKKAVATVETRHNAKGVVNGHNASIQCYFRDGTDIFSESQHYEWEKAVRDAVKKLKRQLE